MEEYKMLRQTFDYKDQTQKVDYLLQLVYIYTISLINKVIV